MRKKSLFWVIAFWMFLSQGMVSAASLPDFTRLVEEHADTVVNISTSRTAQAQPFFGQQNDPAFEFFKRFLPPELQPQQPRDYTRRSLGSGFVISRDGYILTNAHVVRGADEVIVRLRDEREFEATVIGLDVRTDVALIKVKANDLQVATIGDPKKTKVGEWVIAIGSPFGFDSSVTSGIVSAKGRSLPDDTYVPFIQTDVAINPGNSGGPLFNLKGEVIGINSQIYTRSGGYQGVSFAIPIDVAMSIQSQLVKHGKVSRGRLGITIQEVSKEFAENFGLKKPGGALVASVEPDSAADKAGLQPGDIILSFEGTAIKNSSDLPRMVGNVKPGEEVQMRVWRNRNLIKIRAKLDEMKDEVAVLPSQKKAPATARNTFGLVFSDISPEELKQRGLKQGVRIREIRKSGTNLMVNDVIVALVKNGIQTKVTSAKQLDEELSKVKDSIAVLLYRGNNQIYTTLKVLK